MANKSLRCIRAEGAFSTKNQKTTSEILAVMRQYDLMDLLRAKRGGELNQIINNQSHLSLENSEHALEIDGVDEGKSPSLLSSIESREDLDFHDEVYVNRSDGSSTSSSYKSLKLRMMDSNSSEALESPPGVLSSSSDQIFTPRKSSDSSLSFSKESERQSASTVNDDRSPDKSVEKLPSPRGVSVGGGEAKITKANVSNARPGNSNEAQSFFSRAFTGIRSGSQGNVLPGGGSGGPGGGGGWGSGGTSSSHPNKDPESDEKQMDFFSRALTGIRPSPQRNHDDEKKMKALRLESKLKQMDQKSKKFDTRLKELEVSTGRGDVRSRDAKKQLEIRTPPSARMTRSKSQNEDSRTTVITSSTAKSTSTTIVHTRDEDYTPRKGSASDTSISRHGVGGASTADSHISSTTTTTTTTTATGNDNDTKISDNSNSSTTDSFDTSSGELSGRRDGGPVLPVRRVALGDEVDEPEITLKEDALKLRDELNDLNTSVDPIEKPLEHSVTEEKNLAGKEEGEVKEEEEVVMKGEVEDVQEEETQEDLNDDVDENDEAGEEEAGVEEEEDDVVEQELSSSRTPRLGKQYSYEDLRRKSVKMSPSDTQKARTMSITKQFDEEVRNAFHQREDLLNPKEFEQIFGMTKKEFKALPKWRQQELKKRYKLF